MSAPNRARATGRRENGSFIQIPHDVLNCQNYSRLSHKARSILLDLGRQYRGKNNGDLSATWNQLKDRGWHSKGTISTALAELEHYGMIRKTRQGGRKRCNVYAIKWRPVDECGGKLEVRATNVAPGDWKETRPVLMLPAKTANTLVNHYPKNDAANQDRRPREAIPNE